MMKVALSIPSGYHARELLMPLISRLESDPQVKGVVVISPAAKIGRKIFGDYGNNIELIGNDKIVKNKKIFHDCGVSVVVTPTFGLDVLDVPIIRQAKNEGVPVITFIASWDNVFKMERLMKQGHSGLAKPMGEYYELPDYFAVWNDMNRDHLLQILPQIKGAQVVVTGPPRFDWFFGDYEIPAREELLEYLGVPLEKRQLPLVHFATTELYPMDYVVRSVRKAVTEKKMQELIMYASVHPGGDINKHKKLEKYGATVKYSFGRKEKTAINEFLYMPTKKENLLLVSLFKHTSVLVNQSSTVAIESICADVPVINIKYGKKWDWLSWRRSMVYRDFQQHYRYITDEGGTSIVENEAMFLRTLKRYLGEASCEHGARRKTVKKLITYTDGKCGNRLIDLIKEKAAIIK